MGGNGNVDEMSCVLNMGRSSKLLFNDAELVPSCGFFESELSSWDIIILVVQNVQLSEQLKNKQTNKKKQIPVKLETNDTIDSVFSLVLFYLNNNILFENLVSFCPKQNWTFLG